MARLLQMFPPGKVRFILIDPVGLGQHFAQFMHLADYDESLITGRIWTESGHIDKQLTELTSHMETVIQEYLRNQYPTLQEYNDQAGEMAEPYRILVISHFPANFTPDSLRRLQSIINGGSRCGVSALIGLDRSYPFPRELSLPDLEKAALNLDWKNNFFHLRDEDFANHPLHFCPVPDSYLDAMLNQWGEGAKKARRVEVPFEFIAPPLQELWRDSSQEGVRVAIGRSGATRKQFLDLGSGTSQHVLIAGKTGSGKSSLLHALITNLALHFSPEEISLYLVDFKKGVEFQAYASNRLPHAKVIAIESEREFGLSVLARLDAELTIRGESFRKAGSSDLPTYRKDHREVALPRILLVVDEFQEFFVEDDRLAQ
ncbi:MAG: FtsK/SpoIIIE domain-containing protein, partial [Gemmataceae bacterium]